MDIEKYKKLARNKIEADDLTKQVRDVIKITKWQKQDAREGFKETFKPLIESQDSVKKSIDKQQDSLIKQLQANQLALTQGLNRNRLAKTEGFDKMDAATALGELGINKIFGKGITIPPEFFPLLPPLVKEFTKSQRDQINKAYQTGGRLVIKPTRNQIEGGFLGTLASIGIPMAISLVSKMFGGGLQVDRGSSSNTRNVYVPPSHGGAYPYQPPPFYGTWENPIGMGVKKKKPKEKDLF